MPFWLGGNAQTGRAAPGRVERFRKNQPERDRPYPSVVLERPSTPLPNAMFTHINPFDCNSAKRHSAVKSKRVVLRFRVLCSGAKTASERTCRSNYSFSRVDNGNTLQNTTKTINSRSSITRCSCHLFTMLLSASIKATFKW